MLPLFTAWTMAMLFFATTGCLLDLSGLNTAARIAFCCAGGATAASLLGMAIAWRESYREPEQKTTDPG